MFVVPAVRPVTTPELLTVATLCELLVHAPVVVGVPLPDNVVVPPIIVDKLPLIVGTAFTVIATTF